MKFFLGVDPGRKGAFVLIDGNQTIIAIEDMPLEQGAITAHAIYSVYKKLITPEIKPFTVIEKPHSRPTDAHNAIATYHYESGILNLAEAFRVPILWVQPAIWTKHMHEGFPRNLSAKQRSYRCFRSLFPQAHDSEDFMRNGRYHDGRIDALLIAEYARRRHYGESYRQSGTAEQSEE